MKPGMTPYSEDILLNIVNLKVYFYTDEGEIRAVDGVNLTLKRGSILGLVGESGCGKSVTAYSILRLIQNPGRIVDGQILLNPRKGAPIEMTSLSLRSAQLHQLRGGLGSMIFQEPMTALSPVHTIENQLCEAIFIHQHVSRAEARKIAFKMLSRVGIPGPEIRMQQYPHELSGGMRQRILIAMALVCQPELLIADEPTTALDVTIQAQVLGVIKTLQRDFGTSALLITHDLGVVAQMADEAAVMYVGRIVEQAKVQLLMNNPLHPYSMGLLASLPARNLRRKKLPAIEGSVPALTEIPPGCPFHPRCAHLIPGKCDRGNPPALNELVPGRKVACYWREQCL